ncbi:class I SAM-dependent methyltransferase [Alicycliphilus sp. T452]|jgi:SAM-dependent methyltransferase
MTRPSETEAVRARYARRDAARDAQRYALTDPYALAAWQERQRAIVQLLRGRDLAGLAVLEVGCGSGGNLQDLIRLGTDPAHVQGIELLEARAAQARARLPAACRIRSVDALHADLPEGSQDLVLLFTVFSSVLSADAQQALAARVWQWLRPGGAVLWHDFTVNNPRNPDVRGVPLARVRELFPQGRVQARRVTLAPPLGRAFCRVHPGLYAWANAVPWLRTHVLCLIDKPHD